MQASVYEEGTESLALKELGQLFDQAQWVTFALKANPTCVERAFTDRMLCSRDRGKRMEQRNTTTVGAANACIFLSANRYSHCATYICIQNKMDRETGHMSQAESEGERPVWSRRATALSLKTQLKKIFVVLFCLF